MLINDLISLVKWLFLKQYSGLQNAHCFLPNVLSSNLIFIVCMKVNNSSKELHTKCFQGKSGDHIHGIIYDRDQNNGE